MFNYFVSGSLQVQHSPLTSGSSRPALTARGGDAFLSTAAPGSASAPDAAACTADPGHLTTTGHASLATAPGSVIATDAAASAADLGQLTTTGHASPATAPGSVIATDANPSPSAPLSGPRSIEDEADPLSLTDRYFCSSLNNKTLLATLQTTGRDPLSDVLPPLAEAAKTGNAASLSASPGSVTVPDAAASAADLGHLTTTGHASLTTAPGLVITPKVSTSLLLLPTTSPATPVTGLPACWPGTSASTADGSRRHKPVTCNTAANTIRRSPHRSASCRASRSTAAYSAPRRFRPPPPAGRTTEC